MKKFFESQGWNEIKFVGMKDINDKDVEVTFADPEKIVDMIAFCLHKPFFTKKASSSEDEVQDEEDSNPKTK